MSLQDLGSNDAWEQQRQKQAELHRDQAMEQRMARTRRDVMQKSNIGLARLTSQHGAHQGTMPETWSKTMDFRWAQPECFPGEEKQPMVLQQMSKSTKGKEEWKNVPIFDGVINQ